MKFALSLSIAVSALLAVFAAPVAQDGEPSVLTLTPPLRPGDSAILHVNSVSGHPLLFKDRPIVSLGNATINGPPNAHAPPPQYEIPPSFGLENFTVHPPSPPVFVSLVKISNPDGERWGLGNMTLNEANWLDAKYVTQYTLHADYIALGWSTLQDASDCLEAVRCDALDMHIREQGDRKLLFPNTQEGAWDAVKTNEGHGWRVIWKMDKSLVHNEVQITVLPFPR